MSKKIKLEENNELEIKIEPEIKQEEMDYEIEQDQDFIPPDFFDDLLVENVARTYAERIRQENNNCEINQLRNDSEEHKEKYVLDNKQNRETPIKSLEDLTESKAKNPPANIGVGQKPKSKKRNNKHLSCEKSAKDVENVKKPKMKIESNRKDCVKNSADKGKKSTKKTNTFHSANKVLDEKYISERLEFIRNESRRLRKLIAKNPPANILTQFTYSMEALNNERIFLEKYEKPIQQGTESTESRLKNGKQLKREKTASADQQHQQLNASVMHFDNRMGNNFDYMRIEEEEYGRRTFSNDYKGYDTYLNPYYQEDYTSRNTNMNPQYYPHEVSYQGIENLIKFEQFESLDYATKEYKLKRIYDLHNTLWKYTNLPRRPFDSILSEIIKNYIYLFRYEQDINNKFEMERYFMQ